MKKSIGLLVCVMSLVLMTVSCKQSKEKEADATITENVITQNVGKYPRDIKLFQQDTIAKRLKKIAGNSYEAMLKNFQTQTPIVTVDGVYKFTGCKEHDCPSFHTTILYDGYHDNFNIVISKNGKVQVLAEKGKITVSKVLEVK